MIQVRETSLAGVMEIVPDVFTDHRGRYVELFDTEAYAEVAGEIEWVQDDLSVSKKGVLRGIHGDYETTKLVTVLHGEGYAILADNREESPTYRRWEAFELSGENRRQLLIPKGVGNSVLALSEVLVYFYKQDSHYVPGRQFTIAWNDPAWNFAWPVDDPILSERDRRGCYA
ncbi:MAG TPA: dTDP-4-keto-6-deoxy-D-glucose epimerase [Planctomycetes bacterium]|nr:dTDP-4-keto-6-deoxy-D-glucose epimerase [Planctomycetota bacterium]